MKFALRNIATDDMISPAFEELRIFPKVRPDLLEKLIFFLFGSVRRNLSMAR
jgi:hypothetical protein